MPRISGHGELLAKGQERTARLELCSSRGGGGGCSCDAKTEPQRGFHSGRGNSAKAAFVLKQTHPTRFVNMMLLITDASNEKPILPSLMEIILLKQQLFAGFRVSSFVVFKYDPSSAPFSEPLMGSVADPETPLQEGSSIVFWNHIYW